MTDLVPLAQDVLLYRGGATLLAMFAAFCAVISLRLPLRTLIRKQEEDFHGALVCTSNATDSPWAAFMPGRTCCHAR